MEDTALKTKLGGGDRVKAAETWATELVRNEGHLSTEDQKFWGPTVVGVLTCALVAVFSKKDNAKLSDVAWAVFPPAKSRCEVLDNLMKTEALDSQYQQFVKSVVGGAVELSPRGKDIVFVALTNVFNGLRSASITRAEAGAFAT
jgi:hypothetical protein